MDNRDPYRRIRNLLCYSTVVSLIRQGTPATEIAQYIQEDVGECLDVGVEHLTDLIQKFVRGRHYEDAGELGGGSDFGGALVGRSKVEAPMEVYASHLTFDLLLGDQRKDVAVNIDRQMSQAIKLQEHRIAEMINRERQTGIPSRDLRREMETYVGMLVHYDNHLRNGNRILSTAQVTPQPSSGPELLDGAAQPAKPSGGDLGRANFVLGVLNKIRGSSVDAKAYLGQISDSVATGTVSDALLLDDAGNPLPLDDSPDAGGEDLSDGD